MAGVYARSIAMRSSRLRAHGAFALACVLLLAACGTSEAAPFTWDASGGSPLDDGAGNWNATGGTNWFNGTSYGAWGNTSADTATFGVNNGTAGTITVGSVTANGITFNDAGSGNYTLSSGTITMAGSTPTITVNASGTTTLSSVLAGSAGFTKTGAGTLLLGTGNTYTGTTTISQGVVRVTGITNTLGSGTTGAVVLDGGTLVGAWTTNVTTRWSITVGANGATVIGSGSGGSLNIGPNTLYGSGVLTLQSANTFSRFNNNNAMSSQNNFSGKWILDGSGGAFWDYIENLAVWGAGTGDDVITLVNNGTVLIRGGTVGSSTKGITIGTGGGSINAAGAVSGVIAAKLSGVASGTLRIQPGGNNSVLTLTNTGNSYAADTLVSIGSGANTYLRLGAAGVLPDGTGKGNVFIINGGVRGAIDLNGFNETINGLSSLNASTSTYATDSIVDNLLASSTATLTVGGNDASQTFAGVIQNSQSGSNAIVALTKIGSGTQTLSGANTYWGATNINAGTLRIGAASTTGALSGSSAISGSAGATLAFERSNTVTQGTHFASVIGGAINLSQLGSGTLVLNGENTFSGTTRVVAGTLSLNSANALQNSTLDLRSVDTDSGSVVFGVTGTNTYNIGGLIGSRNLATSGSVVLSVGGNGSTGTYSGTISGGGALTKVGVGTLTLSTVNTYTGTTTVNAGILALGTNGVISNQSNLLINGGGLNLAGFADTVGAVTLTSGSIFGAGTLTGSSYALQGGTLASILGTGAITVSIGTTTLGSGGRFNSASGLTVSSGQLTLGGDESVASYTQSGGTLGGSGKVSAPTYALGGGTVSANLGSGTVTVTGPSTLAGTSDATSLNLNSGTLTLGSGGRFTAAAIAVTGSSGGGLALGGNESFASLAGAANIALGSGTLSVGSGATSTTYSGNLSGAGVLAKLGSGTFTLSGNNSQSGGTQIAAGTLRLGSSTALPTSSAVTLGTGSTSATLDFNTNTATLGSITFNGNGSQLSPGGKLNLLAGGTNNATITVSTGSHALHPDTTLQSNTVIDVATNALFSLHGKIDGSGSFTKIGSGTLAITGANTYSGGSFLSGGFVSALTTGALGSGTVTIGNATTLNLNNTILSNTVVFASGSGAIINSGSLVNVTGTYAITSGTGTSITTSYNVLSGGDISFVNDVASTVEVQSGAQGTFTADVLAGTPAASVFVYAGGRGTFSGSVLGDVTTSGSSLFSGSVVGDVTVGGGTATFSGPTDAASAVNVTSGLAVFTGTIGGIAHATASAATIEIRNRVLSTADVNAEAGGTVKLMGSQAFDATTIDNAGSVVVDRSANLALAAVISGSGSLTKSDALTLTLTGNNTFSGLTTISGGTLSIGNGGTSGALAGNVLNNAALVFNRSDDTTFAGNISGSGSLKKLGAGKLTFTGSHSFAGATTVSAGTLAMNGQLGGSVAMASGAFLGGSGVIGGALSGAGVVSPGNSPGILTASQFDPSLGLGAAFEFTAFTPVYNAPTASLNDVLRLTNGTPFTGNLGSGNVINVYFDVTSIAYGQVFEGGFFTGLSAQDLLTGVQNASFNYWIKDVNGATSFNGVNYSTLTSAPGITGVTLTTTARTTDFGGGNVSGSVTQFVIVPEPGAVTLAGVGIAVAGWAAARRRRRAS